MYKLLPILAFLFVFTFRIVSIAKADTIPIVPLTPLQVWIDKLALQESGNNPSVVILDVNHRYSYDCLQFQMATFISAEKKYNMTGDIMDCAFQKRLAEAMITDNYRNARAWLHSVKVIGNPPL